MEAQAKERRCGRHGAISWKHGVHASLAERLLALTRLAPEFQRRLLAMTIDDTPHVIACKLSAFAANVPDVELQRRMFTKLLKGELKLPMPRRRGQAEGSAEPDAP
ncbi:MAG: hypothetical protein AABZ30_04935 [Myxococcota bacterium]